MSRVRCLYGGPAPCIDDLCHGSDTTLCGLEFGFDFCEHQNDPDRCPECNAEDDDYQEDDGQYDDVTPPTMAERLQFGDAQPDFLPPVGEREGRG